MVARSCTRQLESVYLTPQLATQVVKNLFFLAKMLLALLDANTPRALAVAKGTEGMAPPADGDSDQGEGEEEENGEGETSSSKVRSCTPWCWCLWTHAC